MQPREWTQEEIDEQMLDHDDDLPEDDDFADYEDCGELPDGGCALVGTEWCDWHCPVNNRRPGATSHVRTRRAR